LRMQDLYAVLGVSPLATDADLKTAYREMVKRHHPDRARSYVQKVAATKRLQEVNAAYQVLRDSAQRAAYDASRAHPQAATQSSHEPTRSPRSKAAWERRWERFRNPFTPSPALRWLRRSIVVGVFLVAWWLCFKWIAGPPAPGFHPPAWTQHIITKLIVSAMTVPIALVFVASTLMAYVLMGIFAVMLPVYLFQEAWAKAKQRPTQLREDLVARLILLAAAMLVGAVYVLAIKFDIPLLGVFVSIVGWPAILAVPLVLLELSALLAYLVWSRRVVAVTTALSRVG
jgi:DnaJ-domain-containing protein 1